MHEFAISVFPDMADRELTKNYIDRAAEKGYTKVFTSMILSAQNFEGAAKPDDPVFADMIRYCAEKGLKVYCDFNEDVIMHFGSLDQTLEHLRTMGVSGIRIDGGLGSEDLAYITRHHTGLKLQINSSDIRCDIEEHALLCRNWIEAIKEKGNIENVEACFNYYPRNDSGLSLETVRNTCAFLKGYGIPCSAFVSSKTAPSLLHKESHGVPTVECFRHVSPYVSSKILLYEGIEDIFFGDTLVSDEELIELKLACVYDPVLILFRYRENVPDDLKKALSEGKVHHNRMDEPEYVIRCCDSRGIRNEPFNIDKRPCGTVTIDNCLSVQYEGEIQIVLKDLDSFSCANVIGVVDRDYMVLLEYIRKGSRGFVLKGVD